MFPLQALSLTPAPAQPSKKSETSVMPHHKLMTIGAQKYAVETAITDQQREEGLMGRTKLPPRQGMLFVFTPPSPQIRFWMKNTLIPLDMVFCYKDKVVYVEHSAKPCPESLSARNACPVYGPDQLVDKVVELPAGTALLDGLMPGLKVVIP